MNKLLLLFGVTLIISSTNAQWQTFGPASTDVLCLTASDTNVFAGAKSGGLFLSSLNGNTWNVVDSGIPNVVVYSLATNGTYTFAGTNNGMYLSTNNGVSWSTADSGLPRGANIYALAFKDTEIFASTYGSGVYYSANYGHRWASADTGLPANTYVTSMAVMGTEIFAGTQSGGMYWSANNGHKWSPIDTGLTSLYVSSVAISGYNIFVGTYGGGVFLSTNNGSNWTPIDSGLTNTYVVSLAVSGSNIVAGTSTGVFVSYNNGATWVAGGLTEHTINSVVIVDSTIFAGTDSSGVWQHTLTDITSGIQETAAPTPVRFALYPNPSSLASVQLAVSSELVGSELGIYNLTGQLVLRQTIERSKSTIDTRSLAAGMYMVCVKSAGGVITQKLVVTK